MTSFFHGTFLLMGAVLLSKLLGFLYRMQFMRVAGEEAVGVYMTAYPAFIFFLSLVQLGIPIAIAKIVAELEAKGKRLEISKLMRTSRLLSYLSILLFFPIIMFAVPYIAKDLLHDPKVAMLLYVSLFTVPLSMASALLKGLFQGLARIGETAWSQTLEQIIRIAMITWLLPYGVNQESPALTATYAMVITGLAEAVALLYLYWKYLHAKRKGIIVGSKGYSSPKPILGIALPSTGSRLFGSFTWFLEPIVFLKALTIAGLTAAAATKQYGIISGVHIPLLLFPAFIPAALAVVLIPAVSDAVARGMNSLLRERVHIALRLSTIVGCFSAVFFYLYGDALAVKLFNLSEDRGYMKILAPIFFFYYIQSPLNSILQALDEAKAAMMNSVYGGIGKLVVMLALASQPQIAETGAIIAIGFGVLITSFLHIATIRKKKFVDTGFKLVIIPYWASVLIVIFREYILPTDQLNLWMNCSITLGLVFVVLMLADQIRVNDFRYLTKTIRRRL
ncbi:polysaccharide biosynthesis protein [Rummeliibacillus stabekisii]|uniref:putative polysaccharide biosynthesis protein n=1 Tax=Rummeliibacillus TaxID=648802 RepID=UPI00123866D0|nr:MULTISPECIES: polysaccharide biosynthesis protein [Rummeliibacillus]MCM3316840.1 polysaccharide biosynthesis protein [Rummeliibacillus stabekisii]